MIKVDGTPVSTQCELNRDTLLSGQCSRNTTNPFFAKMNQNLTSHDTVNFFNHHCLTLAANGTCLDCFPNRVLDSSQSCVLLDTKCAHYNNDKTCSRPVDTYYI